MSFGLAMPPGFPDEQFEALKDRVICRMPTSSSEFENLAGGHNGVRYRLRACADYSKEFIECVQKAGDAPPVEQRYQQERQLFGFFVCGLSALESFGFFLYFAAAHIRPTSFLINKTGHIKAINPKCTAELFNKEFPRETIATTLVNLIADPKLQQWESCRNILAHRAAPGRLIHASVGKSSPNPAATWKIDPTGNPKIDAALTPPYLQWLITTLAGLVVATNQFTQTYF